MPVCRRTTMSNFENTVTTFTGNKHAVPHFPADPVDHLPRRLPPTSATASSSGSHSRSRDSSSIAIAISARSFASPLQNPRSSRPTRLRSGPSRPNNLYDSMATVLPVIVASAAFSQVKPSPVNSPGYGYVSIVLQATWSPATFAQTSHADRRKFSSLIQHVDYVDQIHAASRIGHRCRSKYSSNLSAIHAHGQSSCFISGLYVLLFPGKVNSRLYLTSNVLLYYSVEVVTSANRIDRQISGRHSMRRHRHRVSTARLSEIAVSFSIRKACRRQADPATKAHALHRLAPNCVFRPEGGKHYADRLPRYHLAYVIGGRRDRIAESRRARYRWRISTSLLPMKRFAEE